ncbi:MAG: molecular chaperone DnaK, partial [Dysgonamonadaceae bacterium]|nr:molecular chaperone DnaK [Dysgonamonadaceae bacterium]
ADSVIFQTEKQLKEIGDKLPADKRGTIEAALNRLKETHKAQDIAGVDAAMAEVNAAFQAASQDLYNAQAQANAGGAPGNPNPNQGNSGGGNDGGVTDVDFEEVK